MGGVIISEPKEGSPIEDLPWVIVFQSLDDSWDSFTCGPYERDHAIALAEAVAVEEDDVLAAVEPLLPALEPSDILSDIDADAPNASLRRVAVEAHTGRAHEPIEFQRFIIGRQVREHVGQYEVPHGHAQRDHTDQQRLPARDVE